MISGGAEQDTGSLCRQTGAETYKYFAVVEVIVMEKRGSRTGPLS